MAFMEPEYTNEPFVCVEQPNGESFYAPAEYRADYAKEGGAITYCEAGKWFARLSAPGYMDCTDWSGPFETEQEARDDIEVTYDVDADTGDELEEV